MYRAMLQVKALQDARSADAAAWRRPRADLVRAIRLAPSDPLILEAYYDSFIAQGVLPPAGAQNGLYEALNLAPGDQRLRHKLAADFEQRDMIDEAIAIIRPLAYAMPHRGSESGAERQRRERERQRSALAGQPLTETAREMLDRLERKRAERAARPGG
jgi:hypothetical protein